MLHLCLTTAYRQKFGYAYDVNSQASKPALVPRKTPISDVSMESLLRAINFFASECLDFTPQLLKVFLFIASHDGCRLDEIAAGTKVPAPAVTHMTNWLSDVQYKGHEPLKWIVKRPCPVDHRSRVCHLTKEGLFVVDNLKAQLYPEV